MAPRCPSGCAWVTPRTRRSCALLADLVERGLDASGGLLVVIDGAKALAAAVRSVFGDLALIQRCVLHYVEPVIMPMELVAASAGAGLSLALSA